MKHLFTLLLFGVSVTCALAQTVRPGKLTGLLTDSTTTKAVPFATAAILDGTKLITGTTTDGAGAFVLPNLPMGHYTLVLSFVGYRTKKVAINLETSRPSLELG